MSIEEDSFHVELLILAYINAKHLLSTKRISKNDFFNKLEEQFHINGLQQYSKAQIISTWYRLVKKYELIKNNPPKDIKKKNPWPLYDIMDSCYDYSDFQFSPLTKFSDEMLWFLVDSVFRKRHYFNSQQQDALDEIYQEFLDEGYVDLTKGDIDTRWKYLKHRYNKFKNCKEVLKRTPYLCTIGIFEQNVHSNKSLVKMAFTRKLTEFLIEQYTIRKDNFLIHGYHYVPLLLEIQKELKKLGYNFSLAEIKGKWSSLTTVYHFLIVRVKHSPWIYFTAMKEHYEGVMKSNNTRRLMRKRSKSIGNSTKIPQPPKRLKKEDSLNFKHESYDISENKNETHSTNTNINDFKEISKLSINLPRAAQDPDRNVHIINIEQPDIDRKNGNSTINLPSISKKFSDNEFLPLKKRLRLEQEKYKLQTDIKDGFRGFSNTEIVKKPCDCARLTDAEMQDILDRAKKKQSLTNNTSTSLYTLPENYLQAFINSNRPYMLIPKGEEVMVDKIGNGKSQMLVLVVKVEGSDSRRNGDNYPKTARLSSIMEQLASSSVTNGKVEQNSVSCNADSYNTHEPSSISLSDSINKQNTGCESVIGVKSPTYFDKASSKMDSLEAHEHFSFVPNNNCNRDAETLYKSVQITNESYNVVNDTVDSMFKSVNKNDNVSVDVTDETNINCLSINKVSKSEKNEVDTGNDKKSIRLPVVSMNGCSITKEIFISPSELDKITHMKSKTTSKTRIEAIPPSNLEVRITNNMKNINKEKMIETNNSSIGEIISHSEDDASSKDNLLSKVIDFHEKNMREFSEIRNLINVNNLLQKETNRMLQKILEKM